LAWFYIALADEVQTKSRKFYRFPGDRQLVSLARLASRTGFAEKKIDLVFKISQ